MCKTYTSIWDTEDTPKKLELVIIKMWAGIKDQNTTVGQCRQTDRNRARMGSDKHDNTWAKG